MTTLAAKGSKSKVLTAYQSDTGNTRKLTMAIRDGILDADVTMGPVDQVINDNTYDLVFLGFPVRSHSVPRKARQWLPDQPEGTDRADARVFARQMLAKATTMV